MLHPTSARPQIDRVMQKLVTWHNGDIKAHPRALLVASEFVFCFLAIHPFQDGNGRLGRALFLLALMDGDDPARQGLIRFISIDR